MSANQNHAGALSYAALLAMQELVERLASQVDSAHREMLPSFHRVFKRPNVDSKQCHQCEAVA